MSQLDVQNKNYNTMNPSLIEDKIIDKGQIYNFENMQLKGGTNGFLNIGNKSIGSHNHINTKSHVPHISSDDPTRSYNLIGSGLNIPRSELKIPNVLIDYR